MQALIYRNEKAIGCLVNPEISISEGVERSKKPESDQDGCEEISLLLVSLSYSHWQLTGSDRTSVRLGIDLDQTFEQSLFRLQVGPSSMDSPTSKFALLQVTFNSKIDFWKPLHWTVSCLHRQRSNRFVLDTC